MHILLLWRQMQQLMSTQFHHSSGSGSVSWGFLAGPAPPCYGMNDFIFVKTVVFHLSKGMISLNL